MTRKWLACLGMILLAAALWGCGSNGGSGGSDVPSEGTPPAKVGSDSCKVCHTTVAEVEGFNGSAHDNDAVAGCEGCHGGGQYHKGTGPIPYPEPDPEQCLQCHTLSAIGHVDDPATEAIIEGLVVKTAEEDACAACHYATHNPQLEINEDWTNSGHGGFIGTGPVTPATADAWVHYNWDDTSRRGSCQRCHTATGISNYLDDPDTYATNGAGNDFSHLVNWNPTGGSGQQEVLYCWGCHRDVSTGELRNPGALTEVYAGSPAGSPSVTVDFPDVKQSNICLGCHVGREIGEVIAVSNGDFSNLPFINSHYLLAAPNIFNVSGYEYGDYQDYGYHQNVGVDNAYNTGTNGPCVACHMSVGNGHTYIFFEKDVDGTITRVDTPICTNCHASMDAETIEAVKAEFYAAAEELRVALFDQGIEYGPDYPYFYVKGTNTAFKNWDGVYPGKGKDVMGAAFNYNLIISDPCSYVHNNDYALKLMADSIDFLNDGLVDGDASLASDLIGKGINLDSGAGYSPIHDTPVAVAVSDPRGSEATCSTCHSKAPHYGGYPDTSLSPASAIRASAGAQWVNDQLISCAECHADDDPSLNQEVVTQYAHSGHGNVTGTWGIRDFNGSCSRCHTTTGYINDLVSGTTFTYGTEDPRQVLNCNGCHPFIGDGFATFQPALAYTATWSANSVTTQFAFPDASVSNMCIRCHSGRRGGPQITNTAGTYAHYLPAAAGLYGHYDAPGISNASGIGFEFIGAVNAGVYSDINPHTLVGLGNLNGTGFNGPCAACHMSGTAGHTWESFEKDEDTGAILAINSDCNKCHAFDNASLQDLNDQYQAALDALQVALEAKRLYYQESDHTFRYDSLDGPQVFGGNRNNQTTTYIPLIVQEFPYLDTTDGFGQKYLIGAAFNYMYLAGKEFDPAAWVHNPRYAKRLVFDSLDFIDNGQFDGTINASGSAAVYLDGNPGLPGVQRP